MEFFSRKPRGFGRHGVLPHALCETLENSGSLRGISYGRQGNPRTLNKQLDFRFLRKITGTFRNKSPVTIDCLEFPIHLSGKKGPGLICGNRSRVTTMDCKAATSGRGFLVVGPAAPEYRDHWSRLYNVIGVISRETRPGPGCGWVAVTFGLPWLRSAGFVRE